MKLTVPIDSISKAVIFTAGVPPVRLELTYPRRKPDPKSGAFASFATGAYLNWCGRGSPLGTLGRFWTPLLSGAVLSHISIS